MKKKKIVEHCNDPFEVTRFKNLEGKVEAKKSGIKIEKPHLISLWHYYEYCL